jgi:hypothetical protein
VAAAGSHREHELYYLVRRYLTPELVRALAIDGSCPLILDT